MTSVTLSGGEMNYSAREGGDPCLLAPSRGEEKKLPAVHGQYKKHGGKAKLGCAKQPNNGWGTKVIAVMNASHQG